MKKQKNFYIHFKKLKRWTKNIIQDVRLQYFLKRPFEEKREIFDQYENLRKLKYQG